MEEIKKYWWAIFILGAIAFFTIGKRDKSSKRRMTGYRYARNTFSKFATGWKSRKGQKFRKRIRQIRAGEY